MIVNLLLFILKHNGIHKVKTEENQATLTTDSRSPNLEFDPRTPEYEGLFPQQRVRLNVVPNDNKSVYVLI
jgi:hypothetical protein